MHWPLKKELASRSFRSMGGLATVTLGASFANRIDSIAEQIRALFEQLERELSAYRPGSAVSRLAEQAGVAPLAVSENAFQVLSLGKYFGELSNGAFDITIAPLARLWGFGRAEEPTEIPPPEAIQEQLKLVDYRRLVLGEGTAFLPSPGMAVDLGGIAKGFAVDRAFDLCRNAGVEDFLIDLSGNIRTSGRPYWRGQWLIGVRDPYDRSRIIGRLSVPNGWALATSGSYERFILVANTRYSHVLDPRTGHPVTGTAGATVLARDGATADGLSTPFFIGGLKEVFKLLRQAPTPEVLIMPDKYPTEIWMTAGFAQAFIPDPRLAKALRLLSPDSP